MDLIEYNLWLGDFNAALDFNNLYEKNIHFILTIDAEPLPLEVKHKEKLTIKFIQAYDLPNEDLLSYFEDAFYFIERGLQHSGVLVHCFCGISRSATFVIAYLMKKKNWTSDYASEYVKKKRKIIDPNEGFIAQLNLFQNMSNKINEHNVQYKIYRLNFMSNQIKKYKKVMLAVTDVIKIDSSLKIAKPDSKIFRCKKCSEVLAQISNALPHITKEKYSWKDKRYSSDKNDPQICKKGYFIEPMIWMKNICDMLEGKLICPNSNCKNKVGLFNWIKGSLCPCGVEVCPAFYLIPSRVDLISRFRS